MNQFISGQHVQNRIYRIRGRQVMLDADIAELYSVPTKSLNLAVRRNAIRFPEDFMFQLSSREAVVLRFQTETSSWGGRRYLPNAFTEEGIAMLSSVLRSERAALVNIAIMRAFVRMRHAVLSSRDVARRVEKLEGKVSMLDTVDNARIRPDCSVANLPTGRQVPQAQKGFAISDTQGGF